MKRSLAPYLEKLLERLRAGPATARQIAEGSGCSKPSAYSRISALRAAGIKVTETLIRDGARGPQAKAYSVRAAPVPTKKKKR